MLYWYLLLCTTINFNYKLILLYNKVLVINNNNGMLPHFIFTNVECNPYYYPKTSACRNVHIFNNKTGYY